MIIKNHLIQVTSSILLLLTAFSSQALEVNIAKEIASVETQHNGQTVVIQRIQDTSNRLVDDFSKTSRPCPPFCLQPIHVADGVKTIGELELLDFLKEDVPAGTGLLIDARMPQWFNAETIPGSINIPFVVMSADNSFMPDILKVMGATQNAKKQWDFKQAKSLVLFCNGPWCGQSPRAIKGLLSYGYPAEKIHYYRGGMNLWRLMGLTTVVSE